MENSKFVIVTKEPLIREELDKYLQQYRHLVTIKKDKLYYYFDKNGLPERD